MVLAYLIDGLWPKSFSSVTSGVEKMSLGILVRLDEQAKQTPHYE